MSNSIVVGTQWGDEGKAKVIDWLTLRSDVIIRYHGGANAGHTVIVGDEKFVFHLVPSGIMYPDKVCLVGNGVVLDIEQFLNEVDDLRRKNISVDGRLFISDLAHLGPALPQSPGRIIGIADGHQENRHDGQGNRPRLRGQGFAHGHSRGRFEELGPVYRADEDTIST
jgi:hypothetical protein